MSTASTIGIDLASGNFRAPAAFIAWNWFWAYGVLASRTLKQIYGIDHQSNPRQDLNKYGAEAVKAGKLTQAQLERIQRSESASANSTEGFTFFVSGVLFALIAGVDHGTINRACTAYTVGRMAYGIVYIFVADDFWAQARGIIWWICNSSVLYLLWKGAHM